MSIDEDAAATNTAVIPNPIKTAMGPSRLPTHVYRRKLGLPINVTDRRRRKDNPPKLLKRFKKYNPNG